MTSKILKNSSVCSVGQGPPLDAIAAWSEKKVPIWNTLARTAGTISLSLYMCVCVCVSVCLWMCVSVDVEVRTQSSVSTDNRRKDSEAWFVWACWSWPCDAARSLVGSLVLFWHLRRKYQSMDLIVFTKTIQLGRNRLIQCLVV